MKWTPNYNNKIINRFESELPLTWDQMDGNNSYGNIWEDDFDYKQSMVVLWNDYFGTPANSFGRISFWICITDHKSSTSPNNAPGTVEGSGLWRRIDSYIVGSVVSGNNIILKMNTDNIDNRGNDINGDIVLNLSSWAKLASLQSETSERIQQDGLLHTEIINLSDNTAMEVISLSIGLSQRVSTDDTLLPNILTNLSQRISTDSILSTEISQMMSVDSSVSSALIQRISVDSSVSTVISQRISVDNSITYGLSSEIYERVSGDTSLSLQIDYLIQSNVFTNSLSVALTTGLSERVSTDYSLSTTISSGLLQRVLTDESLSTGLSQRISTDTNLMSKINQRVSVDNYLLIDLSLETSRRISVDTSIKNSIYALDGDDYVTISGSTVNILIPPLPYTTKTVKLFIDARNQIDGFEILELVIVVYNGTIYTSVIHNYRYNNEQFFSYNVTFQPVTDSILFNVIAIKDNLTFNYKYEVIF